MIEYISGKLDSINPAYVVIDCNGVGYLLNITLPTYDKLQGVESAKLLVYEAIREDAHILYGFIDDRERQLFLALIGVSGVGANTARMILSSIPAAELEAVIATGDHSRLKNVKGIGLKTAQRIIVDLKDKIKPSEATLLLQPTQSSDEFEEALAALVILGFPKQAAHKVLTKIYKAAPDTKVDTAIRQALSML